jgi:hypothetical protein
MTWSTSRWMEAKPAFLDRVEETFRADHPFVFASAGGTRYRWNRTDRRDCARSP